MADSARAAVGNRLQPRSILVWFAFVVFLFWFFDESIVQLGVALATSAILGLSDVLSAVYDLRSEVESLGLALVTLLGGIALFAFEGGAGVGAALVLAGGWLALDAGQVLRHEGLTNDESHDSRDGNDVYQEYVVRQVDSELRERALTRRELAAELDADDAAIDHALSVLTERGLLSREGSELRVSSPPQPGPLERARDGIAASLARLARPLTIEFGNEASETDDSACRRPVEETVPEGKREPEREST